MWSERRVELLFANPCPGHRPCWPCGNSIPVQPDGICEISNLRKTKTRTKSNHITFTRTQIFLTFCPFPSLCVLIHGGCCQLVFLSHPPPRHTHTHTLRVKACAFKYGTSWPLAPKFFSMCFLRIGAFSYLSEV